GDGLPFWATHENGQARPPPRAEAEKARADSAIPACDLIIKPQPPRPGETAMPATHHTYEPPQYEVGAKVATREAYGDALKALGLSRSNVVALDGEVSNSTFAD